MHKIYLIRDLNVIYKNSKNSTLKRQPNLKHQNRYFFKEDTQITKKHMKSCSISLATKQMQIQTIRYHFKTTRKV